MLKDNNSKFGTLVQINDKMPILTNHTWAIQSGRTVGKNCSDTSVKFIMIDSNSRFIFEITYKKINRLNIILFLISDSQLIIGIFY
jgi:hypothetical protein